MKVYEGNNWGVGLQLFIGANQGMERFTANWTPVPGYKNVTCCFIILFFLLWALKISIKLEVTLAWILPQLYLEKRVTKRYNYGTILLDFQPYPAFFKWSFQDRCGLLKDTLIPVDEKQRGRVSFTFPGWSCHTANQHTLLSKPWRLPSGPVARLNGFQPYLSPPSNKCPLFDSLPEPLLRYSH